jgi:tryptophan 2,3-dioxygenase
MDHYMSRPLTEEGRDHRALAAGGEPIVESGGAGNPFAKYLAGEILLSVQHPRTDSAAEPSFLIMSQVMELLFKLSHTEALRARDLLETDDVAGALWTLRRLRRVHATLNSPWDVLRALSPTEYSEFRDQLGDGSGLQSYMYRQMEFLLGNKIPAMAAAHRRNERIYCDLLRTLAEPSLYDAALRLLWRRGLPVPESCVERDWSEPYREEDAVIGAWEAVYKGHHYGHRDLYELAEALVDLAYDLGRWRSTHLLTVERLIGSKVGTGGTSGVKWLRRVAEHRFFPELWAVRGML